MRMFSLCPDGFAGYDFRALSEDDLFLVHKFAVVIYCGLLLSLYNTRLLRYIEEVAHLQVSTFCVLMEYPPLDSSDII